LKKETLIYSEHTTRHFLFHRAEIARDQNCSAKQKSRAANNAVKRWLFEPARIGRISLGGVDLAIELDAVFIK
jgi:hypothetical protein